MLKVLVACANGAGTSLMMKEKAQMALITLGINDLHIDHCDLHSCKMDDYDLIFCPVAFVDDLKVYTGIENYDTRIPSLSKRINIFWNNVTHSPNFLTSPSKS